MEIRYAQTQACRRLEAAARRVHADGGRREGVLGREGEGAPVLPVLVWGFGRAGEDVVPFEDVGVGRVGGDVWWRVACDGQVFFREAFRCGLGGHDFFFFLSSSFPFVAAPKYGKGV